jgi:hypothetical protein
MVFSAEKVLRDVAGFQPRIPLEEGMARVLEMMDRDGRVPDSDGETWEDRILAAQGAVGCSG